MSDKPVNVINPEGDLVSLPASQVSEATTPENGYRLPEAGEVDQYFKEQKYGTAPQVALTALEGAGEGVAGPLFTAAERVIGETTGLTGPEDMLARRETNPIAHGVGQVGGLVGSTFLAPEVSAAKLLTRAGEGVSTIAGLGRAAEGMGALARVGSAGLRGATEMAILQAGDETSRMLMNDPNVSFQSAIADVGLAAALGGAGGAALGAVNPLWEASGGKKLGKFIDDFKERLIGRLEGLEPKLADAAIAVEKAAPEARPIFDPFLKKEIEGSSIQLPTPEPRAEIYDPFLKKTIPGKTIEPAAAELIKPTQIVEELEKPKLSPGAKAADLIFDKAANVVAAKGLGATIGAGIGHAVGHKWLGALIGERALGPFFESVLPAIIKPLMNSETNAAALKSVIDYGASVIRGQKIMNTAAKNVFKPGAEVLGSSLVPSERDRKRLRNEFENIRENPERVFFRNEKFVNLLDGHSSAQGSLLRAAYDYFESIAPRPKKTMLLDKEVEPTAQEKADYNNALDLAQQPAIIFQKIKDGTVTDKDINLIKTIMPAFYKDAVIKLHDNIVDHLAKGESIPYPTRIGLAKFFGEPLDSTMLPDSIAAIQASMSGLPTEPTDSMAVPRPDIKSPKALQKQSSMLRTPVQAAEMQSLRGS